MVVGDLHSANFQFPVRELQNDRIRLVPFATTLHAELFFQGSVNHPELYRYLPYGPYESATEFVETFINNRIRPIPGNILYAIIDKTRSHPDSPAPSQADFAGVIGYLNTDMSNLEIEIGFIKILPPFQCTHVTTNAVGLLLQYALNRPSHLHAPGLGLRRVQWQANVLNLKSIRAAERMGFMREGVLRWDRALPADRGKVGNGAPLREGDPEPEKMGRHTAILAICWDDWENGGEEGALCVMVRQEPRKQSILA
ncbi:acyl-CoA N-acyltransferase [Pisolithus orientalis]|uniref:acyl-CoA N-acyltransferase n=1 Tax=Pisolithus orientalis TaxID=936130 RepID=UPI002224D6B5|nr:acyl-CoA N-acyltransferase [Pisolithus orientalis]KAI6008879.1 acyl-CoA N-acyltransferase [Pisolithus orientalis]